MKKIIIAYATYTGNTQDVAARLYKKLAAEFQDKEFILQNAATLTLKDLQNIGALILGISSWDEGPNPNGELFIKNINQHSPRLQNLSAALFGLGDSAYTEFCPALPQVEMELKKWGAQVYPALHALDGFVSPEKDEALFSWAKKFLNNAQ